VFVTVRRPKATFRSVLEALRRLFEGVRSLVEGCEPLKMLKSWFFKTKSSFSNLQIFKSPNSTRWWCCFYVKNPS